MTIPSLNIPIKPLFVCGHKCNHYNRGSTIWGIWGNEEGAGIIRDETWAAWTGWQSTSSKDQLSTDQLRVDLMRVDLHLVRVDLMTPSHCTVVKIPTKTDSPPFPSTSFLGFCFACCFTKRQCGGSLSTDFGWSLETVHTLYSHILLSASMYILIACSTLHLSTSLLGTL